MDINFQEVVAQGTSTSNQIAPNYDRINGAGTPDCRISRGLWRLTPLVPEEG